MKKILSVVMVLCMLLVSVVGAAEGAYTPGTYTAEGTGKIGPVKVEVTFAADEIESVKVLEHTETAGLADPALERIPAAIVDQQSLAVDAVAGATMTGDAIIAAVAECVTLAGGDVEALKVKAEAEAVVAGELVVRETPVVVVGAGGAGMAAAVKLGQLGENCIVLKSTASNLGSSILFGDSVPMFVDILIALVLLALIAAGIALPFLRSYRNSKKAQEALAAVLADEPVSKQKK